MGFLLFFLSLCFLTFILIFLEKKKIKIKSEVSQYKVAARYGIWKPTGITYHKIPLHLEIEVREIEKTLSGKVKIEIISVKTPGRTDLNDTIRNAVDAYVSHIIDEDSVDWYLGTTDYSNFLYEKNDKTNSEHPEKS